MEYKIVLESFEGPMDLLLHLIDSAEIDIYDIPINEITEQYLEHIKRMEQLDLEVTSEFLLMAATLLEIKSKMLLPNEKKSEEEQLGTEDTDPRLELVKSLIEYKKYKYASKELQNYEEVQKKVYYKPKEDITIFQEEEEIEEMDLDKLVNALKDLLKKNKNAKISINIDEIQKEEYTLDESMEKIKMELEEREKIKFSSLFDMDSSKKEIVITFLSILELIRIKYITIFQEDNFSEIIISKRG
ncbi:MAG: segregation/condensation protein A [Tissierellia bacterium]|nr:segregation/condensation protein A [Tissierellia bacterium]